MGRLFWAGATLTCPYRRKPVTLRPVSAEYVRQHRTELWDRKIVGLPANGCSPDEYPPAVMADVNDAYDDLTSTTQLAPRNFHDRGQRIRYIDADVNEAAGRGLFNVCPRIGPHRTEDHEAVSETKRGRATTTYTKVRAVFTRRRFTMDFAGLDSPADDGIPGNICAPTFDAGDGRGNIKHPGFALLTTDDWFHAHAAEANLNGLYDQAPPNRRSWVQGRGLVVVGSNSSRAATPEELRRELGFDSCGDDECSRELLALREVTNSMKEEFMPSRPVGVAAEATLESEGVVVREAVVGSLPGSDHSDPQLPRETGSHGSAHIHARRKRQL